MYLKQRGWYQREIAEAFDVTEVTVAVIRGRAELTASFTTTGTTPFGESAAEAIVAKVDQRLAKAAVT